MSALTDSLQRRVVELTAHQGEIQARADADKASVQSQINALLAAKAAIERDPTVETVYLTLLSLNLLPPRE